MKSKVEVIISKVLRCHHDLANMCHKWPHICSVCCNHNPVLSSLMTYERCQMWSRNCFPFRTTWTHPPVFSGVRVAQHFVDHCLSFCPFFLWSMYCLPFFDLGAVVVMIVWWLDLQLPVQLVPITTSSNPAQARHTWYNIVIKVVSDLRQVGGFLWVLRFPLPIKLTATI